MNKKEAIEIIKKNWPDSSYTMLREALQTLIPELKESEDERIRKEIINVLKGNIPFEEAKKYIAWIEKHGEQKPVEWDYPYGENETVDKLIAIAECLEMDGDCLFNGYTGTECGKFLRNLARKQVECKPVEWSEEDEKLYNSALWHIKNSCGNGGKDSGEFEVYNWLKSLKDRVQPKQEWSEEDKSMYIRTLGILGKCYMGELPTEVEEELKWFKSITDYTNLLKL